MQFIDEAKIFVKSGDGGQGAVSFRRERRIPRGGPDGGNGGRGGSIIIESVEGLNTLIDFRYKQHFKARNGDHGRGDNMHGKAAEDVIIKVPVGTQIFLEDKETMIMDVTEPGQRMILAKGGDGGLGNTNFKSSVNQAPRHATKGWPGEEMWLWLKLKLLSDVGLVGLPNAGKSTFLSRVTHAKPKIADYPFTTLKPQLGVAGIDNKEFVVADLPGLIEGAHKGHGLGDRFLKHIERCGVILHLIDGTTEDVVKGYRIIRKELKEYKHGLTDKQEIVAINKADAMSEDEIKIKKSKLARSSKKKIFVISAATGAGTTELLRELVSQVAKFREKQA